MERRGGQQPVPLEAAVLHSDAAGVSGTGVARPPASYCQQQLYMVKRIVHHSEVITKHSTVSPSAERRRKAIRSRGAVHPHRPGSGVAAANDGGPGRPEDRSAADPATGAVTCAVCRLAPHARLLSLAVFPLCAHTSPGKLPTWQASDLHALAAA